jgi:hypothetical protein
MQGSNCAQNADMSLDIAFIRLAIAASLVSVSQVIAASSVGNIGPVSLQAAAQLAPNITALTLQDLAMPPIVTAQAQRSYRTLTQSAFDLLNTGRYGEAAKVIDQLQALAGTKVEHAIAIDVRPDWTQRRAAGNGRH